ncbi:hypothetical protein Pint_05053 [Pistacia integerrima]|uniref:Uncharacterized protein n=1 Tax=Pistacia integerrima TaxID=434235 RepID=A0ACC0Z1D2_9ROSI|nr:hypothetical protein Pint_05053 [Pistacia integerrima]
MEPQPHMRRHSKLMEFPHLSASHKELMAGIISALETRLQSELLPSSVVPPDVEYYQNETGLSQGTLHIRRGLQSSHIDFMLASWLHLQQPNGGGAMNVTNLQVYLKPSINVPHFQLELVQCTPSYMIFFVDLTPRKDLVLNPDYLKTFYEETQLDVYRQNLDRVPEIKPYFSSSLYFRGVVSPTGILVSIKCEDGDGGKDRCEGIIRENVSPIAYEGYRDGSQLDDAQAVWR